MSRAPLMRRFLDWLRAGYPHGIPQHDYIALFGILHRDLTEAEVEEIAMVLHEEDGGNYANCAPQRIRDLIQKHIHEAPSDMDVARVSNRLAQGGWPLSSPPA